jgi:ankyrin repeat protein
MKINHIFLASLISCSFAYSCEKQENSHAPKNRSETFRSGKSQIAQAIAKIMGKHETRKEVQLPTDCQSNEAYDIFRFGTVEQAKQLRTNGCDIISNKSPYGPLYIAAVFGNEEMVKFLTKEGAHVNDTAPFLENSTPLHGAIEGIGFSCLSADELKKRQAIVEHLMQHGANPDARKQYFGDAWDMALKQRRCPKSSCTQEELAQCKAYSDAMLAILAQYQTKEDLQTFLHNFNS